MKKLLLHTCCAPCGSSVFERLLNEGEWEITSFYYNPNTRPWGEWEKRLYNLQFIIQKAQFKGIELIVPKQDEGEFMDSVKGSEAEAEGGKRCEICFRLRLRKTAWWAKDNGFDSFGTTLTVSPHKNAELINRIGRDLAEEFRVNFLDADFKKKDGFKRSTQLCREYGIYRQSYCGCNIATSHFIDHNFLQN